MAATLLWMTQSSPPGWGGGVVGGARVGCLWFLFLFGMKQRCHLFGSERGGETPGCGALPPGPPSPPLAFLIFNGGVVYWGRILGLIAFCCPISWLSARIFFVIFRAGFLSRKAVSKSDACPAVAPLVHLDYTSMNRYKIARWILFGDWMMLEPCPATIISTFLQLFQ